MQKNSIPEGIRLYYVRTSDRTIAGTVAIRLAADGKFGDAGFPDKVDRAIAVASLKGCASKKGGRNIVLERLYGLRRECVLKLDVLPYNRATDRFVHSGRGSEIPTPLYMAEASVPPTDFEKHIMRREVANGVASQPAA